MGSGRDLIPPLNQCHSPSQGQQEVGQGADSAEETSCFPLDLPGPPRLGISLSLAAKGFAVCKARIELYISPLPCPLAGQTFRRGAQKLRWLCSFVLQLRDPEGGKTESPSSSSGKARAEGSGLGVIPKVLRNLLFPCPHLRSSEEESPIDIGKCVCMHECVCI